MKENKKFNRAARMLVALLVAAVLMMGFAPSRVATAQTEPWVNNYVNGHSYRLTEPLSWFDAEAQAQSWGGHLVTLDNAEEEFWVKNTFGRAEHFWIGFNDIVEECTWVWASGMQVSYTNWDSGEPNNCCFCTEYPGCEDAAVMNWKADDGSGNTLGEYWNDLAPNGGVRGVVERDVLLVDIDIKPDVYPNPINLRAQGVIPVAVLTNLGFDATTVDPVTVHFAGASPIRWSVRDVDYDGDMDILFQFKVQQLALNNLSVEATLTGANTAGMSIQGVDTVRVVR